MAPNCGRKQKVPLTLNLLAVIYVQKCENTAFTRSTKHKVDTVGRTLCPTGLTESGRIRTVQEENIKFKVCNVWPHRKYLCLLSLVELHTGVRLLRSRLPHDLP